MFHGRQKHTSARLSVAIRQGRQRRMDRMDVRTNATPNKGVRKEKAQGLVK